MRFGNILLAYFVIGAIMWGGGLVSWDKAGVGHLIVKNPSNGDVQVNNNTSEQLGKLGGPIQTAVGEFGGGLIAIWSILKSLIGYLFWPIIVLKVVNAPPRVIVLGGGIYVVAFFSAALRLVRRSA